MVRSQSYTLSTERIGSLDGLRGIAILSVIFVHWVVRPYRESIESVSPAFYNLLDLTAHGVDVFFVVSGFLIGRILLTRSSEPGFLQVFYVRRFLRIIPLYFAVICVIFIVRGLVGGYPESAAPLWSYFLFVNNIYGAAGVPDIAEYSAYWSLAIEEQFYLSSALLAVFLKRRGVVLLAIFFIVASLATRTTALMSFTNINLWQFTLGHADPIGIGLLAAAALESPQISQRLRNHAGLIRLVGVSSFVAFLLTSLGLPGEFVGTNIFLISIAVACWILLKFIVEPRSWLSAEPLRRIGEMSFSLYILHLAWIVYADLIVDFGGVLGAITMVMSFVILLGVCRLLWVYVEAPLIALGHTWQYGVDRITAPSTATHSD